MTLKQFIIMASGFNSIGLYDSAEEKLISANDAVMSDLYLFEDCEVVKVTFGLVDDPKDKAAKYIRACIYLKVVVPNTNETAGDQFGKN
jgi:hypothetical protein